MERSMRPFTYFIVRETQDEVYKTESSLPFTSHILHKIHSCWFQCHISVVTSHWMNKPHFNLLKWSSFGFRIDLWDLRFCRKAQGMKRFWTCFHFLYTGFWFSYNRSLLFKLTGENGWKKKKKKKIMCDVRRRSGRRKRVTSDAGWPDVSDAANVWRLARWRRV